MPSLFVRFLAVLENLIKYAGFVSGYFRDLNTKPHTVAFLGTFDTHGSVEVKFPTFRHGDIASKPGITFTALYRVDA